MNNKMPNMALKHEMKGPSHLDQVRLSSKPSAPVKAKEETEELNEEDEQAIIDQAAAEAAGLDTNQAFSFSRQHKQEMEAERKRVSKTKTVLSTRPKPHEKTPKHSVAEAATATLKQNKVIMKQLKVSEKKKEVPKIV